RDITKKIGSPKQPSNPFLEMVKFLLERIAPVHIDTESISALVKQVLSFTHPVSFHSAETFESLLGCLKMEDEKVAEAALQIFKNTGSKMEESFPHIKSTQAKAKRGPPRQAKYAIHCIQRHFAAPLKSLVANFIVKDLLMNDRIAGKKTTKLWVPDDEVSAETMAK
ncbi:hypothetical protein CRUP_023985, partial [Coryphaenoides rupestris]